MRSLAVTVIGPLLFAWHSTPNAYTGSSHCCQAAGDSISQWKAGAGGGWWGGEGEGGRIKNIHTYLTLDYKAARTCVCVCVVIKCLSLSAGVRWVTCWRWDDAVRSYTLPVIDNCSEEKKHSGESTAPPRKKKKTEKRKTTEFQIVFP